MPKRSTPSKYTCHSSGQARFRIDGKVIYIGPYDSPESREKYVRVIENWIEESDDQQSRTALSIEHLALAYYVKNDETTDHIYMVRAALKLLVQHHRHESVGDFSRRKLKRLQQVLIDRDRSRTYINDLIGVIKRCF